VICINSFGASYHFLRIINAQESSLLLTLLPHMVVVSLINELFSHQKVHIYRAKPIVISGSAFSFLRLFLFEICLNPKIVVLPIFEQANLQQKCMAKCQKLIYRQLFHRVFFVVSSIFL